MTSLTNVTKVIIKSLGRIRLQLAEYSIVRTQKVRFGISMAQAKSSQSE